MQERDKPSLLLNIVCFLLPVAFEILVAPFGVLGWLVPLTIGSLALLQFRLDETRRGRAAALSALIGCVLVCVYLVVLLVIGLHR